MSVLEPFVVAIDNDVLTDLDQRLRRARFPKDLDNRDWSYGTNGDYLRELIDYWIDDYDWRARERSMNEFSHRRAVIDGVAIHFVFQAGRGPAPMPIILSNGWPWTFWDYRDVI